MTKSIFRTFGFFFMKVSSRLILSRKVSSESIVSSGGWIIIEAEKEV